MINSDNELPYKTEKYYKMCFVYQPPLNQNSGQKKGETDMLYKLSSAYQLVKNWLNNFLIYFPEELIEKWNKKKDAYKKYFDKGAKDLTPLIPGQVVWIQRKPEEKSLYCVFYSKHSTLILLVNW